ncbi:DUF7315 family membrane protein [Halapricum salinum]|uniref:DUF7315 domain-containing protein n=1 Tax=Halapricum salinum TaxID=1457250 RepID=A0A4D6H9D9_9EURY|nr:hypothetical protein [Halapricum salinum]QCC49758.1 hypothetical protein DV733_00290 [Halapricum salinum]
MADSDSDRTGRREDGTIVVPMRMYKGITVFSTLVATVLVVLGFVSFDAATRTDHLFRTTLRWVFEAVGVTLSVDVLNVLFGLLGVGLIVLGAGSYILGTRFKTEGMVDRDEGESSVEEEPGSDEDSRSASDPKPERDE